MTAQQTNSNTREVLKWLAKETRPNGEMCAPFRFMMRDLSLDRKTVRKACRLLKRREWAEFHVGLWNEDGEPQGSGYCISHEGLSALAVLEKYNL